MSGIVLRGISKFYGSTGVLAVDSADFSLIPGEVHALVGENGAGKSTLAKIMSGFEIPDSGSIEIFGLPVRFASHKDAERAGIGFVPQHSMLAMNLTISENMALGHEPRRLGIFYDARKAELEAMDIAERFGFSLDLTSPVGRLSASARREAEILRALARGVRILVLDEPTTVLNEHESEHLFQLISRLKAGGTGIVYISHRAKEILRIADRVTVMRGGRVERTEAVAHLEECVLSDFIVPGGTCIQANKAQSGETGKTVFRLDSVFVHGRGADSLSDVSLAVCAGEIVGVAALSGNGLETLESLCAGILAPQKGSVTIAVESTQPKKGEGRRKTMAYIPSDREGLGLSLHSSVSDNISAGRLPRMGRLELLGAIEPAKTSRALMEEFSVKAKPESEAQSLSGGNRQRLVAARELADFFPFVLAANPVQGLDAGARDAIFSRLLALRDQGAAILILSTDAEDFLDLANRSYVLYRGALSSIDSGEAPGQGQNPGLASLLTGGQR